MRISDWSSDVCSSDLEPGLELGHGLAIEPGGQRVDEDCRFRGAGLGGERFEPLTEFLGQEELVAHLVFLAASHDQKLGRVSSSSPCPWLSAWARWTSPCELRDRSIARLSVAGSASSCSRPSASIRSDEHTSELQSLSRLSYA